MKQLIFAILTSIMAVGMSFADENRYAQGFFPVKSHDFGIIKEEKGPVSYTFEVENTGNKNLVINDVKVECSCTSKEFTRRPIAPGKKGKIKVTYNPLGTPGAFRKKINVYTNGRTKVTTLFVEGTTVPQPSED